MVNAGDVISVCVVHVEFSLDFIYIPQNTKTVEFFCS